MAFYPENNLNAKINEEITAMKKITAILLAAVFCFAFTLAAAPKKKSFNPFKSELKKIEKVNKDIEKAEEKKESSEKKDALKDKLKDAEEKLAKKKERLTEKTGKEIADLEKKIEKLKAAEKPTEKLESLLAEKQRFLKSIPIWADGDEPEEDEISDDKDSEE